ncbi:MAG: hypothetical protein WCI51_10345 [Lentisphaerota bacterium]
MTRKRIAEQILVDRSRQTDGASAQAAWATAWADEQYSETE